MATNPDWLPKNHLALYDQAIQTWKYLSAPDNRERMGFAATGLQGRWLDTEFAPKYDTFVATFNHWQNPAERTLSKTARLYGAEREFKPVYRELYVGLLKRNPLVADTDLLSMGLPERHSGHSRHTPVPETYPNPAVVLPGPAVVEIHFYDKGSTHRAKPAGVHGAEMAWAILDVLPTNWEELTLTTFNTHSPFRLSFELNQRGKTIYYALRWQNNRGEPGPWGQIHNVIIP
jgi:hypothetical protein